MLDFGLGVVRDWNPSDQAALAAIANDRLIWRNFRDQFPHPYTADDACRWIARARQAPFMTERALVVDGQLAGGIGVRLLDDIYSVTGLLGFWLGQPFRGRGIATAAIQAYADPAMASLRLARLEARVFAWNQPSCRVLERAGFVYESVRRNVAWKDAQLVDELIYVRLKEDFQRGAKNGHES